jgi:hypothetical protein
MSASTTQLINNGASLKVITSGVPRNILKQQIREISVINGTIIKIDIGQGALNNIFITFSEVTNPVTASPDALTETINGMLASTGAATDTNQQAEISELQKIKSSLLFSEPEIMDETEPRTIYKGYAAAGSLTSAAVWAIEKIVSNHDVTSYLWANGDKNFDKVWDNRATLIYL